MALNATAVQQLYVAYLGREADEEGLQYWTTEVPEEFTLADLRWNLVNLQSEYTDMYGGLTREETLEKIYQNMFDRAPDAEGLAYWTEGEGGAVPVNELLQLFIDAAAPADRATFDAKVPAPQEPSVPGDSFSLTAGADTLTGTADDDTFSAPDGSLGVFDSVDGGAGVDTLSVEDATELTSGASIANIETINVVGATGVALNASTIADDIETISNTRVADDAAAALTVNGLTAEQTVSVAQRDVNGNDTFDSTVTVNASVVSGTTANLEVAGANVDYVATIAATNTTSSPSVETVNITATGDAESTVTFGAGNYTETDNVVVSGAGALILNVGDLGSALAGTAAEPAAIIDASAATGDVELTVGATAVVSDITLGAGDDTLTVSGLVLTDSDITLEGGEGNDTFNATSVQIAALQNVGGATVSGFEELGVSGNATLDANVLGQVGFEAFNLGAAAGIVSIDELDSGSNIVTLRDGANVTIDIAGVKTGSDDSVGVTVIDDTTSTITVAAGIETLNIVTSDSNDESGFDVANLTVAQVGTDLESLVVSGDEAVSLNISAPALDSITSIDFSGITSNSDADAIGAGGVAAPEYAVTVITGTGVTVTGSEADDSITFGLSNEVTGSAGDDTFVVGYGTAESATTFSTITDFQEGDAIDFGAAVTSVASTAVTVNNGPGIPVTFQNYLDAASNTTAGQVNHFEFDGNTYLVFDADGAGTGTFAAATDELVQLSGSVDLTGLETESATTTTVEIA